MSDTPRAPGRLPVVFIPHGGGPWPFVEVGFGTPAELGALAAYLRTVGQGLAPRALLVVSAHWEEPVPTVMSGPRPPLYFDYYGFPKASYQLTWPAPGDPQLAARVRGLLHAAGFQSGEDAARGFDHGTFVPLKLAYPGADVPAIQLSLRSGLDPAEHLSIGRALQPLRDEGVFIVGSGMSFHNMRGFSPAFRAPSQAFDDWLCETTQQPAAARAGRLVAWTQAPSARLVHPRPEHLLPLMVVAGAAGEDAGRVPYRGTFAGVCISAHEFG